MKTIIKISLIIALLLAIGISTTLGYRKAEQCRFLIDQRPTASKRSPSVHEQEQPAVGTEEKSTSETEAQSTAKAEEKSTSETEAQSTAKAEEKSTSETE